MHIEKHLRHLGLLTISFLTLCAFVSCTHLPSEIPSDFQLEFVTGPTHAERSGHHYSWVRSSGDQEFPFEFIKGVRFRFISKQNGEMRKKEEILSTRKLVRDECLLLFQCVSKNRFFKLKKSYINQDIRDGSYRRLIITSKGLTKSVVVVNKSQKHFDRIIDCLNKLGS